MTGSKHTPGPWTIIPARPCEDVDDMEGFFASPASIEGSDGSPVCTFGSEDGSGTLFENRADYCLIAAAPDMLAALKDCAEILFHLSTAGKNPSRDKAIGSVSERAGAAIARAENSE